MDRQHNDGRYLMVEGNDWLDTGRDGALLMAATLADTRRIQHDERRLELNVDASYDAGFEAGVLASEAGVGRYDG